MLLHPRKDGAHPDAPRALHVHEGIADAVVHAGHLLHSVAEEPLVVVQRQEPGEKINGKIIRK